MPSSNETFLFFDVETTGVPKNWKAPVHQVSNWPRAVQLAWIIGDGAGLILKERSQIIKPDGYTIPFEAEKIHGISTERALKEGREIHEVLSELKEDLKEVTRLIAHNIDFDSKVLGAEFIRWSKENLLEELPEFCTMKEATHCCRLPGRYGFKWPSLEELHLKVLGNRLLAPMMPWLT